MAQETEIKFSLLSSTTAGVRQWLVAEEGQDQGVLQLENIYFDTPDYALQRLRMALRIRTQDGAYIQTLKTRGQAQGGVLARQEWEWPLTQPRA